MLLAFTHAAGSAPAELGIDVMQNIEDTNKSLASHLALKDGRGALADARSLDELFAEVELHFSGRPDASNAVGLTKKSRGLLGQIITASQAADFDGAAQSAAELSRTCRTCHTFYKKE